MNSLKYMNASRNIYREYEDDIGYDDQLDQSSQKKADTLHTMSYDRSRVKSPSSASLDKDRKSVNLLLIDYLNKEFISLGFEAFLQQPLHSYFATNATSPTRESIRLFEVTTTDTRDQRDASELINSDVMVRNMLTLIERYKLNLKQFEEEKEK